jgi:hypothetical protein
MPEFARLTATTEIGDAAAELFVSRTGGSSHGLFSKNEQSSRRLLARTEPRARTMAAEAGCRLFEHRDYGGAGYTLNHFERMKMVNGESVGCTTHGHGGGCESIHYEPSWNDQVSSFKVTPAGTTRRPKLYACAARKRKQESDQGPQRCYTRSRNGWRGPTARPIRSTRRASS